MIKHGRQLRVYREGEVKEHAGQRDFLQYELPEKSLKGWKRSSEVRLRPRLNEDLRREDRASSQFS